ncbi:hypothetical protein PRZ48_002380 [Zasmidium cellare]|uniref:ABM domain-containing protein n=1 Tax=Zasmidium cellare TaxID=395010 RepID=A0ABR0F614_ZASCE|nr:hypothetical protein PRZ48_002380 [Zasmidium cellare]
MSLVQLQAREPGIEAALQARLASLNNSKGVHTYQQIEVQSIYYILLPTTDPSQTISNLTTDFRLAITTTPFTTPIQPPSTPFLALGHFTIPAPSASPFDKTFEEVVHVVEDFSGNPVARSWVEERDEFVMFSGWESMDAHVRGFVGSEGFKEWVRLREFVVSAEVRHLRPLEGGLTNGTH